MITPAAIIAAASSVALVILGLALLLTVWRVIAGPTLPDRILALDMLTGIAIGYIAVIAIKTGFSLYIDIAISLGLVGFLATVAFARFVLSRADINPPPSTAAKGSAKRRRTGRRR
ncbi:cation:proton antiporter [Rhizobium sp. Pop5]|uniref:cation:proton antiporter n=1 Tax=Rhizobium sp. Pop5 TaxID=1223565 RepID=UPI000283861A|nr:cation:proton antiporter [Rhizobium sp. Pop5]EJZ20679.1 monovalent cation/H+ antiporter subunit F [Rhizobium sp. Pop5]UVD57827.1 cation:proton antiporter [Rhizobium sp. Pop5]